MVSEINSKVGNQNISDLDKITVGVVKKALKLMKNGIFDFQSDCHLWLRSIDNSSD